MDGHAYTNSQPYSKRACAFGLRSLSKLLTLSALVKPEKSLFFLEGIAEKVLYKHINSAGKFLTEQERVDLLIVVDGGGRNEETYSKYAAGARIKQHPSRRQQQRLVL